MKTASTFLGRVLGLCVATIAVTGTGSSQATQRTYVYDALGNRVSATNQARFTSAAAFSIEPRRAIAGDTVNIYGRNFPFLSAANVSVSASGQAATVVSVAPSVITFTMPAVLVSGQILVTIQGSPPLVAGDITVEGITITPNPVEVDYLQQVQFSAAVTGGTGQPLTWKVNDVAGGNGSVGTISNTGLYTAPAGSSSVEFPILVSATSARLDVTSYAIVKTKCSASTVIADDTFGNATFVVPYERDCYEFMGGQGQYAYIAYLNGPTAKSLKLRNSDGVVIAAATNGTTLRLGDVLLPETDLYRIEVESSSSGSGAYQVWFDLHDAQPEGVWLYPLSDVWHDSKNWSLDRLPTAIAAVSIPDKPGSITITVGSGIHKVASVTSVEGIKLMGGSLEVVDDIQVSAPFQLMGGTLITARVVAGTGGQTLQTTTSGGTLDGVRLAGDLELSATSSYAFLKNGITLNGGNILLSGISSYLYYAGTQAIGGTGEVRMTGVSNVLYPYTNNVTLTIGPNVTLRGRGTLDGDAYTSSTFLNQGTIRADIPGATLSLQGTVWQNTGLLEATNSATLQLNNTCSTSGLGKISGVTGAIELLGTVINTNATLVLDAGTGPLYLRGGTIQGGSIVCSGANSLRATTSAGTLDGVTLTGDFDLSTDSSYAYIKNSLALNGGNLLLSGGNSYLYLQNLSAITGTGQIAMTGTSNALYPQSPNTIVTFGANVTVHGRGAIAMDNQAGSGFVNLGTIRADLPNSTLNLRASNSWENQGTLSAINGSTLALQSAWSNTGTINETASTINLGGTFTLGATSSFVRTGGSVNLSGTLTNSVLPFNATTGSWNLLGGTVIGGTIQGAGGYGLLATTSAGTLDGVTLAGDLHLSATSSYVYFRNSLTLNGGNVLLSGNSSYVYFQNSPTVSGTGQIALTGTSNALYPQSTNTVVTFGPNVTVHGRGTIAMDNAAGASFVNQGTIRSDITNSTLTLRSSNAWLNSGTLSATNGATLTLLSTWSNTGTLSESGATLNLGGTFTLSPLGSFARTGGVVNLTGILTNTLLSFSATTGSWYLLGGSVIGGTIQGTGGNGLVATSSGGTLDGVTLANDFDMSADSALVYIKNALTLSGGNLLVSGSSARVFFQNSPTVSGTGQIAMTGASNALYPQAINTVVTFGPNVTVRGRGTIAMDNQGGSSFINQGTIRADIANSTLTLQANSAWQNQGTLDAINRSTLTLSSTWSNTGTISENGSTINLGGNFTLIAPGNFVRTGGNVNLTGILNNTTLSLNATSGSWNLMGGTVLGGTIQGAGGAGLMATPSAGTLDTVTLAADFDMSNDGSYVYIKNSLALNNGNILMSGSGEYVYFQNSPTVTGTGQIAMTGASNVLYPQSTNTVVTFGPNVTVHGRGTLALDSQGGSSFINQGTIRADIPGATLTLQSSSTWQNQGTLDAINGSTLALSSTWSNSGTISESGSTVNLGGNFTLNALGNFVRSGGIVNLTGILNNTALSFSAATGSWNLMGGTVLGGTIQGTGGNGLVATPSGGTLDGVTLGSDFDMSTASCFVYLKNALTLSNNAKLLMSGNSAYAYFATSLLISGTGQIAMTGASNALYPQNVNTVVTFGPNVTVRGRGTLAMDNTGGSSFINQGTLRSDIANSTLTLRSSNPWQSSGTIAADNGATILLQGANWSSQGILSATNNATMTLSGNWSNTTGSISSTNSTLNLGGAFASTGIGAFTRSGGSVNLTGMLTNTVLTFGSATGSWNLLGGTVLGGTLQGSAGNGFTATTTPGTLDAVTLANDLDMSASSANVYIKNALTLNGGRILLSGASAHLYFQNSQTISGTGQIALTGTSNALYPYATNTLVTFGPNVIVRGAGTIAMDNQGGSSFINQGTIRADIAGATLTLRSSNAWQNQGTLDATNGGALTTATTWSSTGTIGETNSTINLGGTFSFGPLSSFVRSFGTVNLTGTLNNTQLSFTATTGSWNLLGGTVLGGTLQGVGGNGLASTTSGGTLDAVTLASDFDMSVPSSHVFIKNSLVLNNGNLLLSGAGAYAYFQNSPTVSGTGQIWMTGTGNVLYPQSTNTVVTFGPNVLLHGRGTLQMDYQGGSSFINQGILRADIAGSALTLRSSTSWQNTGSLQATNSGTLSLMGAFTTAGLGNFIGVTGTIDLVGVLTNATSTLNLNASTGSISLRGGTVIGGTIQGSGGSKLIATSSGGTLDGVTLASEFDMSANSANGIIKSSLVLNGSNLSLTGSSAYLYFQDSLTVSGTGGIAMTGTSNALYSSGANTVVTFGPNITLHGRGTVGFNQQGGSGFINQGVIKADIASSSLTLYSTAAWQNPGQFIATGGGTLALATVGSTSGTVQIEAGSTLSSSVVYTQNGAGALTLLNGGTLSSGNGVQLNGGLLRGFGTINGPVTNAATVEPGVGAGTLTINGAFTQTAAGALNVQIGGTTVGTLYDRLAVSGAASFAGALNISPLNGFAPISGTFGILTHASRTGTFAPVTGTNIGNGHSFVVNYSQTSMTSLDVL